VRTSSCARSSSDCRATTLAQSAGACGTASPAPSSAAPGSKGGSRGEGARINK
jgi:hypothetical protein